MAEKTTTKKPAATATPSKTAAAKKTAPGGEKTAPGGEKTTSAVKKTTAAAKKATAAKTAEARAVVEKANKAASTPAATARKAISVRKRSAATVARSTTPAGEAATGWRRFRRKTKVGVVTSAKQAKTVIVTVGRMREHPLYKKVIHLRKGFAAHDELGEAREGDLVRIQESRPYSATKRWRVVEILSRSGEAAAAAPRVADVAGQLEQAEGVTEMFAPKPEREEEEAK